MTAAERSLRARRRAEALARLAGLYSRHLVRRAVHRGRSGDGLRRFDALYTADRITAVTEWERARLGGHGACIACGLCDFAAQRAGFLTAERLPLQLTRNLSDLWVARDLDLRAVDWTAADAVCPVGVPLSEVAELVAARLGRDGIEPPPPSLPPRTSAG